MNFFWKLIQGKLGPALLSLLFVVLAILHALNKDVVPDVITLGLLFFAVLPWLIGNVSVKSVELLGMKIEFEMNQAVQVLQKELAANEFPKGKNKESLPPGTILKNEIRLDSTGNDFQEERQLELKEQQKAYISPPIPPDSYIYLDPNISIIDLGIEVEKRIYAMAKKHQIDSKGGVDDILEELVKRKIIGINVASVFENTMMWRNQVAHGVSVTPAVALQLSQLRDLVTRFLKFWDSEH
jgi:hypothetical protein